MPEKFVNSVFFTCPLAPQASPFRPRSRLKPLPRQAVLQSCLSADVRENNECGLEQVVESEFCCLIEQK